MKLLADIQDVFAVAGDDRLSSADLAAPSARLEESPWGDLWGRTLDARGLARRLKPFSVRPRTVRFDDGTTREGLPPGAVRGRVRPLLGDRPRRPPRTPRAPFHPILNVTTSQPAWRGFALDSEPSQMSLENSRKPAQADGCDDVTLRKAGDGART